MKKIILLHISFLLAVTGYAQNITTIAGTGIFGVSGNGGPATIAKMQEAEWLTVDSKGNVYISGVGPDYIRKIDRKGIIDSFAYGEGDLAADDAGNVYQADVSSGIVYRIDPTGVRTRIAGGGTIPFVDGMPATDAAIGTGEGILCLDQSGNLYLAATNNSYIFKITPSGIITHVAGDGAYATTSYSGDGSPATSVDIQPNGVAVDSKGNIYFDDQFTNAIHMVNTSGYLSTPIGVETSLMGYGGDGGPASSAHFYGPTTIRIDKDDNIFVLEVFGHRIRRIDATTKIVTTVVGNGANSGFYTGTYSGDNAPAISAGISAEDFELGCAGNIYLADGENYRVRKVTYVQAPAYAGEPHSLSVCENGAAISIDTFLRATDPGIGETIGWDTYAAPKHGAIAGGGYSTTVTGAVQTPAGLTYTPTPGYSGPDSFTIVVGACLQNGDARTIYVTVNPLPAVAAITGLNAICKGSIVSLSNATTGGTWGVAGTAVTVAAGTVTGITPGTATISYTVTDGNGCSTAVTTNMKVGNCPAGITSPASSERAGVRPYPNPARDVLHIDGITEDEGYKLVNMVGSTMLTGTMHSGVNNIPVSSLASGIYMLEITSPAGMKTISRIIKQ